MSSPEGTATNSQLIGKAALIASVGGQRGYADWTNPDHRFDDCWPNSSAWLG